MLAAAAVGFVAVAYFVTKENDRLLEDLPIIEKLEQYRDAKDIETLRLLENQRIFEQEGPKNAP